MIWNKKIYSSLICAAMLMLSQAVFAAPAGEKIYTSQHGSSERNTILSTLRQPVAKSNDNKPFAFKEVDIKVSMNGWAYVETVTVDAQGKPVGPDFTNELAALLQRRQGQWRVVEWAYRTDVISIEWESKHPRVPAKLWPHNR